MISTVSLAIAATTCACVGGAIIGTATLIESRAQQNRLRRQWLPSLANDTPLLLGTSPLRILPKLDALVGKLAGKGTHIGAMKRQLAYLLVAVGTAVATGLALGLVSSRVATATLALSGVIAGLIVAHALNQGAARVRAIDASMPAEIEKLAVYLAGGYSLVGALSRIAERSKSPCTEIFEAVARSMRGGGALSDALAAAQEGSSIPSLTRLTKVLEGALYGADLVKAARNEAASQREDLHRRALAEMEKNSQKVWIPITIAALVPGIVLIFVPFVAVMKAVTGS